jgi:hypothetical protein
VADADHQAGRGKEEPGSDPAVRIEDREVGRDIGKLAMEGKAPDPLDGGVLEDPVFVGADRDLCAVQGGVTAAAGPSVGGIRMDGVQVTAQIDRVPWRSIAAEPEGRERALEGRELEAKEPGEVRETPPIGVPASAFGAGAVVGLAHLTGG